MKFGSSSVPSHPYSRCQKRVDSCLRAPRRPSRVWRTKAGRTNADAVCALDVDDVDALFVLLSPCRSPSLDATHLLCNRSVVDDFSFDLAFDFVSDSDSELSKFPAVCL